VGGEARTGEAGTVLAARPGLDRRRAVYAAASFVLFAAYVLDLLFQPAGRHASRVVDDLVQFGAGAAMAGAAFFRARRSQDRMRLSWLLIGVGGAGWASGQAIWTFYEVVLSDATPFPSAADAGYLMLPIFALTGLLVRPSQAFTGRGRLRIALDVLLILASMFTVSWATAFGAAYRGADGLDLARIVGLAYPAGDIALLSVVVVVLAYASTGGRSGLLLLGSGLALFCVADSGFAYLTAHGNYNTGDLIDAAWVAGFAVMAWAAAVDRAGVGARRVRSTYLTVVLPFLPTLVGLSFVAAHLGPAASDQVLPVAGAVMVLILLVRQVVVVSDNFRLVEGMRFQAFHDPLTGLSNRALFNDRLAHALDLHRRDGRGLALLLVDLDNFKLVNDSLGHVAGDELLVQVSRRLARAARRGDTVARLGGDEFAILVEDGANASDVAARALAGLAQPVTVADRQLMTGASIGIAAVSQQEESPTASEMLQRADVAMYAAKRGGKGLAHFYSAEMATVSTGQLEMQAALMADLAAGRIDVAFQPIYKVTGGIYAVETLARWKYRGDGVSPDVFLAMARELGCINILDEAVLRAAVEIGARLGSIKMAVNLDRQTLAQPSFATRVQNILGEGHLAADRLVVEVLEFDFLERDRAALDSLTSLRGLGALVSVDDFGAGYATLARLRLLQPDVLKIDRSLVAGSEDPTVAALLTGAAQLGRHIGASVVAEGVETDGQLRAAMAAGCDAVQGFYLGRPVGAETLLAVLDNHVVSELQL
jgi:diguanylate cyclase (GGDEF)-like protein